jgi:hypothetical protein
MASLKDLKLAEKAATRLHQVVMELKTLQQDIERCEHTITGLQVELSGVNTKYPAVRTTREDIAFLSDLLKCANKKLAWEKQIASLQKRTPLLLEDMVRLMNDPKNPPAEQTRAELLLALQGVQAAMERLQSVKVK